MIYIYFLFFIASTLLQCMQPDNLENLFEKHKNNKEIIHHLLSKNSFHENTTICNHDPGDLSECDKYRKLKRNLIRYWNQKLETEECRYITAIGLGTGLGGIVYKYSGGFILSSCIGLAPYCLYTLYRKIKYYINPNELTIDELTEMITKLKQTVII